MNMMMEKRPYWAYRVVGADERELAIAAYNSDKLFTNWNCSNSFRANLSTKPLLEKAPKAWAGTVGWPTPLLFFEKKFMETMFANDENFRLALGRGGVELFIPVSEYVVPVKDIRKWERQNKDPKNWDSMAYEFWALCKVIDLGVTLVVEDQTYTSSSTFYNQWIYKRYKNLEDGADIFILGD